MDSQGGWSTRELAELAGTTLKTVRYYHRIGLLTEPDRGVNGYKHYRVAHLIRLLRIRRLVALGLPLADIPTLDESEEDAERILRALDAELAASIERQQRMRADLAGSLRHLDPAELPPTFRESSGDLSEFHRAFALLGSRIHDPWVTALLRGLLATPRTDVGREFDALTEEASDQVRQDLAERYAPEVAREQRSEPRLTDPAKRGAAGGDPRNWSLFLQGVPELYNPAQIDVLRRINAILRKRSDLVSHERSDSSEPELRRGPDSGQSVDTG
ncbi:MerR family transcriptional regulator [Streptomyces canus]|uniref:MerR family transcriptional regulator n=1 Tax=Streptomyces canus TaxID=58343 RepID=UPI002E372BDC|nr:MerR family transcriptional regulator [Streptomyces canus]